MEQQLFVFGGFVIGLSVGLVSAWLVLRAQIATAAAQAHGESKVEIATISTQLDAAEEDGRKLAAQRTRLESDLETSGLAVDRLKNDLMQAKTELAERSQLLEDEQHRIQDLETARKTEREKSEKLQADLREKAEHAAAFDQQCKQLSYRIVQLENEHKALTQRRDDLTNLNTSLSAQVSELTTKLDAERKQSDEKLKLLKEAGEQLTNQFKALSNDILEEKAKRFTEQNQVNLDALLSPLKTKLQEFETKVDRAYDKGTQDRTALSSEIQQLMALNQRISDDANNLTRALKGQSKAQGNWGELILERVLETCGLTKGIHYEAQESHIREDGTRAQTDVVIHLPEQKHLVVDAKVSLVAFEEYANADTDDVRNAAIARHLNSVRSHIKGLSSKNYQDLYQLKSLDFVLMFVPVEPAFMLAISQDSELWQDGWKQNVLLVSPSTLLFVIRTVAHLWRQEDQNRNAQEIAKGGAELYDKLVGFVGDLDKLGERLRQAQDVYRDAYNKFTSGRGNAIGKAEMLRKLGVKPKKQMSVTALENSLEPEDLESLPMKEEEVGNRRIGASQMLT